MWDPMGLGCFPRELLDRPREALNQNMLAESPALAPKPAQTPGIQPTLEPPGAVGCFCIEGDILCLAGFSQVVCRCSWRVRAYTQMRSLQRTPFRPRVFKFSVEDRAGLSQRRKLSVPCKMTRSLVHSDHFRVCKAESARLRLQCHVGQAPLCPSHLEAWLFLVALPVGLWLTFAWEIFCLPSPTPSL